MASGKLTLRASPLLGLSEALDSLDQWKWPPACTIACPALGGPGLSSTRGYSHDDTTLRQGAAVIQIAVVGYGDWGPHLSRNISEESGFELATVFEVAFAASWATWR